MKKAAKEPVPVFWSGESEESTTALVELAHSSIPFAVVPTEACAPVLTVGTRTFHGLDGIRGFIAKQRRLVEQVPPLSDLHFEHVVALFRTQVKDEQGCLAMLPQDQHTRFRDEVQLPVGS